MPTLARRIRTALRSIPLTSQLLQLAGGLLLVLVGILVAARASGPNPVPLSVRRAVPFAVYYPNVTKLPKDCYTDDTSFSTPQSGVVLFAVECSDGKLVLSEQQQPSQSDLQKFYASLMPRHQSLHTAVGTAQLGLLINGTEVQNAASLPVGQKGPWIIVTADPSVSPQHLRQVVLSLER